jgi:hypothetical protein
MLLVSKNVGFMRLIDESESEFHHYTIGERKAESGGKTISVVVVVSLPAVGVEDYCFFLSLALPRLF